MNNDELQKQVMIQVDDKVMFQVNNQVSNQVFHQVRTPSKENLV